MNAPDDAHEWLSFEDDKEDRTWLVDVTFLESGWECIFGAGCQGVYTEAAPERVEGCCSYGAHFVDEKDVRRVEKAAAKLTDEQWQFKKIGTKRGITRSHKGDTLTRLVDGACLFLNRPGFAGGPGCALHRAASERGIPHLRLKPEVCWQLPLRREDAVDDQGHVTSRITEWQRRHWGPAGEEFHWWCTEAPEAFRSKVPVYVSLADELRALMGKTPFQRVTTYLNARSQQINVESVRLPHPAVRRRA